MRATLSHGGHLVVLLGSLKNSSSDKRSAFERDPDKWTTLGFFGSDKYDSFD